MNNSAFALTHYSLLLVFVKYENPLYNFGIPVRRSTLPLQVQRDYFGNQAQGLMLKQHRKIGRKTAFFFFLNFSEIHILGYFSVFFHQQQPASHQYHTQHSKISSHHFHFSSKYNPAASFRIVYAQWLKTRHWIRSSYEILLMTSFKLTRTMSTQKIFLKTFVA